MADYIYLLENRLSAAQRSAIHAVREIAKSKGLTLFLVGGAVRDLTSGSPVRDLDVVVQGNALKIKKDIVVAGGTVLGEVDATQALYVSFPGSVRMEIGSTLSVSYPKPGKPVAKPATILDDLRRRDFTANAMALSLNEGSYGLLMDPLNGVADIENRQLRLVSNYGFIEDPIRMVRAARLMARLGWTLDEKTQARYETGKSEGYISAMSDFHRGYETEEIVHEEDPLRVLKRLEDEGWMKHLAPYWTVAKANAPELERLRESQTQLQMQAIHPDPAAANFPLLTAKLSAKEVATLKSGFTSKGFVTQIESLEGEAKDFATQLGAKSSSSPSAAWKLIVSSSPEAVLWTAFSSKSAALQSKFKSFSTEWPQVRQKIPYVTMQEMRITKDLPIYDELLEKLFFELMDGHLETPEEIKAFLEPYSPPAPPPPVSLRRPKAAKAPKSRSRKAAKTEDSESDSLEGESTLSGAAPEEAEHLASAASGDRENEAAGKEEETDQHPPEPTKPGTPATAAPNPKTKAGVSPTAAKASPVRTKSVAAPAPALKKAAPVKMASAKTAATRAAQSKPGPAKTTPAKSTPTKSVKGKPAVPPPNARKKPSAVIAKKAVSPAKKVVSAAKKAPVKSPAKAAKAVKPTKKSAKTAPAKKTVAKLASAKSKKTSSKSAKKR